MIEKKNKGKKVIDLYYNYNNIIIIKKTSSLYYFHNINRKTTSQFINLVTCFN